MFFSASPGTSFSSYNKTDRHNITEIVSVEVALNTIALVPLELFWRCGAFVFHVMTQINDFLCKYENLNCEIV